MGQAVLSGKFREMLNYIAAALRFFQIYYTFIMGSKSNSKIKKNAIGFIQYYYEYIEVVFNVSTNHKHTQKHTVQL